jgi:hypothetical protein
LTLFLAGVSCRTGKKKEETMAREHDSCNGDGARRLKQKIEQYWKDKGFAVHIKLIDVGFQATMRSARTDVRSDMVNGRPVRRANILHEDQIEFA